MMLPFDPQAISEEHVRQIATRLGLMLSHDEQMAFVRSTEPLDLQAAPGSGKTSLLALKLCLLAESWDSSTYGVCVLSHTNTAKDQIIERITSLPTGFRLLRNPHFIGTIQTFVNTFFALPHLRAQGIEVQSLDDVPYSDAAHWLLQNSNRFFTLRNTLARNSDAASLLGKAHYIFDGTALQVVSTRPLPFGPTTASGKQFIALKESLARRGFFRYEDMFALATQYLHEHPSILEAARMRFPFVLIDEMQDTSQMQEALLSSVFPPNLSVVQRIGDINQRIFGNGAAGSDGPGSFPDTDAMDLPISRRFGSRIASVANLLTVHRPQHIQGEGPLGVTALLVFDHDSVDQVVPTFERLAAQVVPESTLGLSRIRVLGSRKQPGSTQTFPQSLACYVPEFTTMIPSALSRTLIQTARYAQALWCQDGIGAAPVAYLWDAVCDMLRHVGYKIDGRHPVRTRLKTLLDETNTPLRIRLREWFIHILNADLSDKAAWDEIVESAMAILREITSEAWSANTLPDYLAFVPFADPGCSIPTPLDNHRNAVRAHASTIHSAKGETHSATLILECLDQSGKKHDVREVLALISANKNVATASITVRKAAQLIFVGVTRPTHLLALAVLRENAEPYLDTLSAQGWDIHYVAAGTRS
ncbi:MAG TPA: UvrD-helicase domain-containing protein [Actinocrinis sp.]|nr:UvrD-helicase domain-containing protein [Actinocrinis sp.]